MKLGQSKQGRDKDQVYVIIEEQDQSYLVADGKYKLVDTPKRKNKKHIQIIGKLPEDKELKELAEQFDTGCGLTDVEAKRILTLYKKYRRNEDV